tara:strand:+ start:82 stop:297 length:216 start_codon:yes stop_codon:yes gene_type:complete
VGIYSNGSIKKIKISSMNVQFEFIRGFLLGVDYLEGVEHNDFENGNVTFDLLRISLGIVFIHIPINVRDTQ